MDSTTRQVAVYGASGYTGKLVVAELARRGAGVVVAGRDAGRLRAAAEAAGVSSPQTRAAALDDADALAEAFDGCGVVVNCAGPFVAHGEPVVRAAVRAGCHYADISGEERHVEQVFDTFAAEAERADVTVVPMVNDGGFLSDLVTSIAARGAAPIDMIRLSHRVTGSGGMSRGSVRTALVNLEQMRSDAALPEVVTVRRHVSARRIEGRLEPELLPLLAPEVLRRMANLAAEGPDERQRRRARFTVTAEVTAADGRRTRGVVEGADTYKTTAVVAAEAAVRLARGQGRPGVLAPAQTFDPEQFLDSLRPHGVTWSVCQA